MNIKASHTILPSKRFHASYMSVVFLCLAALLFCAGAEAQPVGEVYIAGNTWQELQWQPYAVDEMISLDTADNTIYLTWTYAPPPPQENLRRSYYNSYNPQTGWAYPEPGCWMFPGVSNREFHTLMLKDNLGGLGDLEFGCESMEFHTMRAWWEADSFMAEPLDTAAWPSELWVRRANSPRGMVSLLGYESSNNLLLFSNYQIEPYSFRGWQLVDTISAPSYCIATGPISERVAICYSKPKNIHMHHYAYTMDSDFYLLSSPDGTEWDWQDRTDVTHFRNLNPLRPLGDGDVMIDHDNQVHLAFTTWEVLVDSITPESIMVNPYMTHIWHWSEASDSFSLIAENWIHQPPP